MKFCRFLLFVLLVLPLDAYSFGGAEKEGRPLEKDEKVEFYPAIAQIASFSRAATLTLEGRVYESAQDSVKRSLFIKALAKALDLDDNETSQRNFTERASMFMNEGGEKARVAIFHNGRDVFVATSGEGGFFHANFDIDGDFSEGVYPVSSMPHPKTGEVFKTQALFIGGAGVSIVSDIDDTVKDTNVLNRKEMIRNTFVRDFKAVPGMADLYRRLLNSGGTLHFVSAGPAQLAPALNTFFAKEGFPAYSLHMRQLILDGVDNIRNAFSGPEQFKYPTIKALFEKFPKRKFLLVGDSGEKDPEVYAQILAAYPTQVLGVWIHDVTNEAQDSPRYKTLFPGGKLLKVFRSADELPASFRIR